MYRQGELDFGLPVPPWRPKLADGLFFALLLEPPDQPRFADCLRRSCELCGIRGDRLKPARFHVTLQNVRNDRILRTRFVYGAKLAARKVFRRAFEVRFGHVGSFRGRPATRDRPASHPFVLLAKDGPVCDLSSLIGDEMRKYGLRAADQFLPHMTFGYDEKLVRPLPVEEIDFVAREFVLIHSLKGLGIYRFLDRWPLYMD